MLLQIKINVSKNFDVCEHSGLVLLYSLCTSRSVTSVCAGPRGYKVRGKCCVGDKSMAALRVYLSIGPTH